MHRMKKNAVIEAEDGLEFENDFITLCYCTSF